MMQIHQWSLWLFGQLNREGVLLLRGLDSRLSKDPPSDIQKLRCKVAFHALWFAPPILELGTDRMRNKGSYLALHLRMEKDVWVRAGCLPGLSSENDEMINNERVTVFMPSHGGNMGHAIQGHRAYAGQMKYITPNKGHMLPYFLNSSLPEAEFNNIIKELHGESVGQPELHAIKAGRDVTKYPVLKYVYLASAIRGASLEEYGQNGESDTTFPMTINVGEINSADEILSVRSFSSAKTCMISKAYIHGNYIWKQFLTVLCFLSSWCIRWQTMVHQNFSAREGRVDKPIYTTKVESGSAAFSATNSGSVPPFLELCCDPEAAVIPANKNASTIEPQKRFICL
ncbi:hypothetical protein LWI29_021047 [Acer saccharum]|uniref:O-fucosyltransferase family protein n=1 Tax=Acer saccharum TaxID=4024 RepID=A0AA39RQU3_ACESA|nr:hypothetical protein LWI29_021047 [Acer saccharum]